MGTVKRVAAGAAVVATSSGVIFLLGNGRSDSVSEPASVIAITSQAEPGLAESLISMYERGGPFSVCYDENEPPTAEQLAATEELMRHVAANGERYNAVDRWSFVAQGEPVALTWSLVPDGVTISLYNGTGPSTMFADLDAQFGTQGGRATWVSMVDLMFDRYEETSGTSYTRITFGANDWDDGASWPNSSGNANRGDVRIAGGAFINEGGVLAFNYYPNNGDMSINMKDYWAGSTGNFRRFRNLLAHEHGHGLGLAHMCSSDSGVLMDPIINTGFDGPSHDDLRAVQFNYGDPFEPNNSSGSPSLIATMAGDESTTIGELPAPVDFYNQYSTILSLADAQDDDWLAIDLTEEVFLTIIATPKGFTYDDSDQSGNCVYNQSTTDSVSIQNLRLELYEGGSLVDSANATAAGQAEQIVDARVGPGTVLLRVDSSGGSNQSQMYLLDLLTIPGECATDNECDDGDPCNGAEGCVDGRCETIAFVDCNTNGIDDSCDISSGFSEDCNENGIPDECDVVPQVVTLDSGEMSPFGDGFTTTAVFPAIPSALGDMELTVTALGDLGASNEEASVRVQGFELGKVGFLAVDCDAAAEFQFTLSAAAVEGLSNPDGSFAVDVIPTSAVDPTACGGDTWARVVAVYTGQVDPDENGNSVPDSCETAQGCGLADTTTTNSNPGEPGYGQPDGGVNGADLSYFVERWLAGDLAVADVNTTNTNPGDPGYGQPDGGVNGADLSYFVEVWLAGCVAPVQRAPSGPEAPGAGILAGG